MLENPHHRAAEKSKAPGGNRHGGARQQEEQEKSKVKDPRCKTGTRGTQQPVLDADSPASSVVYLNNQILKPSTSTKLGQLLSVPPIVVQNHVIKSHENENETTLSERMNLFPCSVNVCSQFVLKSRVKLKYNPQS